jgi:hypothetical protein
MIVESFMDSRFDKYMEVVKMYTKGYIKILVIIFCFVTPWAFVNPSNAEILFYEDFEEALDMTDDWRLVTEGNIGVREISDEYSRAGKRSMKFSVSYVEPLRTHLELRLHARSISKGGNFIIGRTYWIGWSMNVLERPKPWNIAWQMHGSPDKDTRCPPKGEVTRNPMLHLFIGYDGYHWQSQWENDTCQYTRVYDGTEGYASYELHEGTWVDWVVKWKLSYHEDGILQIWRDGKLIVDQTGPNCYNDEVGPTLRFGIYAYSWGNEPPTTTYLERYFDEIRIGDENSSFEEVSPGHVTTFNPQMHLRLNTGNTTSK